MHRLLAILPFEFQSFLLGEHLGGLFWVSGHMCVGPNLFFLLYFGWQSFGIWHIEVAGAKFLSKKKLQHGENMYNALLPHYNFGFCVVS